MRFDGPLPTGLIGACSLPFAQQFYRCQGRDAKASSSGAPVNTFNSCRVGLYPAIDNALRVIAVTRKINRRGNAAHFVLFDAWHNT